LNFYQKGKGRDEIRGGILKLQTIFSRSMAAVQCSMVEAGMGGWWRWNFWLKVEGKNLGISKLFDDSTLELKGKIEKIVDGIGEFWIELLKFSEEISLNSDWKMTEQRLGSSLNFCMKFVVLLQWRTHLNLVVESFKAIKFKIFPLFAYWWLVSIRNFLTNFNFFSCLKTSIYQNHLPSIHQYISDPHLLPLQKRFSWKIHMKIYFSCTNFPRNTKKTCFAIRLPKKKRKKSAETLKTVRWHWKHFFLAKAQLGSAVEGTKSLRNCITRGFVKKQQKSGRGKAWEVMGKSTTWEIRL
jgi:hypothetical protein